MQAKTLGIERLREKGVQCERLEKLGFEEKKEGKLHLGWKWGEVDNLFEKKNDKVVRISQPKRGKIRNKVAMKVEKGCKRILVAIGYCKNQCHCDN